MKYSLIAAVSANNAIGLNNELLFKNKEDMKFFRNTTINNIVIMGRKTFESIGKPLDRRFNIVVTSDTIKEHSYENLMFVNSIEEAFEFASYVKDMEGLKYHGVYVIGGGSLYEQTIKDASGIVLSKFKEETPEADTFFPKIDEDVFIGCDLISDNEEFSIVYYFNPLKI